MFGTVKLNLENKKAEKELKKFSQKQRRLKEANPTQYKEFIKQMTAGLRKVK